MSEASRLEAWAQPGRVQFRRVVQVTVAFWEVRLSASIPRKSPHTWLVTEVRVRASPTTPLAVTACWCSFLGYGRVHWRESARPRLRPG